MDKRHGRRRLVAIRGLDEELYRLVKMYASLEDRTVASIVEEALQRWVEERGDLEELRLWLRLERMYEENLEALRRMLEEPPKKGGKDYASTDSQEDLAFQLSLAIMYGEGYALACNGEIVGVFSNYEDAAREAQARCSGHALIARLPLVEEEVELGLPW